MEPMIEIHHSKKKRVEKKQKNYLLTSLLNRSMSMS